MNVDVVDQIARNALWLILKMAAPVLLVSLIVGLTVSIFQTVTSIQEQTLTFVPKILAIFISLMVFGNWMLTNMTEYVIELWSNFSLYITG
jgi:flagellar biosynthetic protein FliQ